MTTTGPDPRALDRVALRALEECRTGMRLGLGTGRAAEAFIRRLGAEVTRGALDVVGVPTSARSDALAREVGIRVASFDDVTELDVAFDGADEVDPSGQLVKGLGGAMLRERVVASEARRFVVLVTPEKLVARLGERSVLPIEVVPFAEATATRRIARLGATLTLRRKPDGTDYRTDNGNVVLDLAAPAGGFVDPRATDRAVRAVPGVVDTGFFFDMASLVLVGEDAAVRVLGPFGA
jgi:ribose 5-phosphate isomerase A